MTNYCRHWIGEYAAVGSVLWAATVLNCCAVEWETWALPSRIWGIWIWSPLSRWHIEISPSRLWEGMALPLASRGFQGMPGCLRSVASVAIIIDKSAPVKLASDCALHVPHSVQHILNTCATRDSCTSFRWWSDHFVQPTHYCNLLTTSTSSHISCPLHREFEAEQDCDLVIETSTSPRPNLMQTPTCFDEFERSLYSF